MSCRGFRCARGGDQRLRGHGELRRGRDDRWVSPQARHEPRRPAAQERLDRPVLHRRGGEVLSERDLGSGLESA